MKLILLLIFLSLSYITLAQKDSLDTVQKIEEVVVSFENEPSYFFKKKNAYILDFEEDIDGLLILYKQNGGYYLEKVNWEAESIILLELSQKAISLEKDCLAYYYIKTKSKYYRFEVLKNSFQFDSVFEPMLFENEIKPCIAASDNVLLFNKWGEFYQSVFLWTFDFKTNNTREVYAFSDTMAAKDLREMKAKIQGDSYDNHSRMKDIWISDLYSLREKDQQEIFYRNNLIRPKQGLVFSDSIHHYFFNILNDSIYKINQEFEIKEVYRTPKSDDAINTGDFLFDQANSQFYFVDRSQNNFMKFQLENELQIVRHHPSSCKSRIKCIRNSTIYFVAKETRESNFNVIFKEKF